MFISYANNNLLLLFNFTRFMETTNKIKSGKPRGNSEVIHKVRYKSYLYRANLVRDEMKDKTQDNNDPHTPTLLSFKDKTLWSIILEALAKSVCIKSNVVSDERASETK